MTSIRERQAMDIPHLKAPDHWVNDPNGFIYYKGNYHLFYQYFPYEPRWGTMHWGHAVSRDLVEWNHLGIALYPSIYEDQNGCFSGSAVQDEGKLFLLYTGVHYFEPNPEDVHVCLNDRFASSQIMIWSEDGYSFDHANHKSVVIPPITDPEIGDSVHSRDPKVWKGEKAWYLVLGARTQEGRGKLIVYESQNLREWTLKNSCAHVAELGWMCECPDYIQTEHGGVLVYSVMGYMKDGMREENQVIWMPAEFDEEEGIFRITGECRLMDYGLDLYAPQSTQDEAGIPVQVSWLRMPEVTKDGWIGMFSFPRRIRVQNGEIYSEVHPNISRRFTKVLMSREAHDSETCGKGSLKPSEWYGDDKQLSVRPSSAFLPYRIEASLVEDSHLNVGGFELSFQKDTLVTDRTRVFPDHSDVRLRHKLPQTPGGCRVEIYVDEYLIEVYANNGQYVLSNAVNELTDEMSWDNIKEIRITGMEESSMHRKV